MYELALMVSLAVVILLALRHVAKDVAAEKSAHYPDIFVSRS